MCPRANHFTAGVGAKIIYEQCPSVGGLLIHGRWRSTCYCWLLSNHYSFILSKLLLVGQDSINQNGSVHCIVLIDLDVLRMKGFYQQHRISYSISKFS